MATVIKTGYKKWVPTLTSNWVSRIFWLGTAEGGILPIAIGMKEAKAAAFQLCSPIAIGTAVEANSAASKS